ncbi:hypothetical protein FQA39_LY10866 [Lamprigera yunnana]|nr:hypothetical protein FQA39_LY10866 [Lamprigera yunnana]
MEIEFPTRFSIKSEIIEEETFSFSEIFEGYPNDELKLEPVECKPEPLDAINESQFGIEQSDLQDINYRCDFCPYTATQQRTPWRSSLTAHLKIHKNDRPFQCNVCLNRFVGKGDLKKHLMIHSKDKPYHCTDCNYKAARSYHLKIHREAHERRKQVKNLN